MRLRHITAALLVVLLSLTGCGGGGASNADGDGVIRLVVGRMASGVDPVDDLSSSYLRMYGAAEGLVKVAPDGSVAPELAESIERTGPLEWKATLRDNAVFWSGAPVDAKAVVASFNRSLEHSTLVKGLLQGVQLTAEDDNTVVFSTAEPAPYLDYALAHYSMVIHNATAYDDAASSLDPSTADLTGPYRLIDFMTDRGGFLERNDSWWGGEVGADAVEFTLVTDEQTRAELALTGQADIVESYPSARVAEAEAVGLNVVAEPGATTVAVYLNPASPAAPALADQRVRQALALATDRDEIVELATHGLAVPASSWLASNPGYPEAASSGYTDYDPARAGELLDAAGWLAGNDGRRSRDGRPLTIRLLTFGAETPSSEVLQAQWRKIGVDLQVLKVEDSLANQSVRQGDWDAVTQAWTTLGNVSALIANQIGPDGAANHGGYVVPQIPDLLRQSVEAPEDHDRRQAILSVNDVMIDVVPSVPLHPRVAVFVLSDRVNGFQGHPLQYETVIRPEMTIS